MGKKIKEDLSVYILIDRSGSMGGARWEHAISSVNTYTNELKSNKKLKARVTVAAFDSQLSTAAASPSNNIHAGVFGTPLPSLPNFTVPSYTFPINNEVGRSTTSFDIIRDSVLVGPKYKNISNTELKPRGGTPLYDATGMLLNLADKNNNEKTVIIIVTDGEENQSTNYNLNTIRDRIATCQHRGWEVIFMGAEFNADTIARSYGLSEGKVINPSLRNMNETMSFYATASANYVGGREIDTMAVKKGFER